MNVVLPIARQPKLLSEGGLLPVPPVMKVEVSWRAKESQTEGLSGLYSMESISNRAEAMTAVLEGILRSRPVPHWERMDECLATCSSSESYEKCP